MPLLPAGVALARALGQRWSLPFVRARTSPYQRCRHTSQAFFEGAGIDLTAQDDRDLGDPGPFVIDPGPAWEAYFRLTKRPLVRLLATEPESLLGFRSVSDGVERFVSTLLDRGPGRTVGFSHDIVISVVLTWVKGTTIDDDEWPDFHEGIGLWLSDEDVVVAYRGQEYRRMRPGLRRR